MKHVIKNDPDYHNKSEYIGSTSLKRYKISPLYKQYLDENPMPATEAMDFGSMYHAFILEPELFEKDYQIIDDREIVSELSQQYSNVKATKAYKEWLSGQINQDKLQVEYSVLIQMQDMRSRLMSNFYIKYLLTGGENEVAHYTDEFNGCKCKFKPDSMITEKTVIADLKILADSSFKGVKKYVTNFEGHIQAAYYCDLFEHFYEPIRSPQFFWIAQEKKPPYDINIIKASEQLLNVGRYEYTMLLEQHRYCLQTGIYSGQSVFADNKFGIRELDIPAYAIEDYQFHNKFED